MRTLINVCGASFSGTTMLDLMLGNAPDSAACGEVGAWFRPRRRDRVAVNCPCGEVPCPRWGAFSGVAEDRFHLEAMNRWDVTYLSDSTKRLSWVFDANRWAAGSGIRVVNLLIWKDPVTHAYSHWKRRTPIREAQRRFVRYHERFLGLRLPFAAIHYDDFTRSPAESLAEVCRVAGVPYFEGRERFWATRHHNLFGNEGTRGQIGKVEGGVRPPGPFPIEFLRDMEAFRANRGTGPRLRRILESLRGSEVASIDPGIFDRGRRRAGPVARYWYYEHWVKQVFRTVSGRLRPPRPMGDAVA